MDSLTTLSSEARRCCGFVRYTGHLNDKDEVDGHIAVVASKSLMCTVSSPPAEGKYWEVELAKFRKFQFVCAGEVGCVCVRASDK